MVNGICCESLALGKCSLLNHKYLFSISVSSPPKNFNSLLLMFVQHFQANFMENSATKDILLYIKSLL